MTGRDDGLGATAELDAARAIVDMLKVDDDLEASPVARMLAMCAARTAVSTERCADALERLDHELERIADALEARLL